MLVTAIGGLVIYQAHNECITAAGRRRPPAAAAVPPTAVTATAVAAAALATRHCLQSLLLRDSCTHVKPLKHPATRTHLLLSCS
jgi:hypothetical protein